MPRLALVKREADGNVDVELRQGGERAATGLYWTVAPASVWLSRGTPRLPVCLSVCCTDLASSSSKRASKQVRQLSADYLFPFTNGCLNTSFMPDWGGVTRNFVIPTRRTPFLSPSCPGPSSSPFI